MKPYLLYKAKDIEIDTINTLGIILGPYRNLTTLTASMLMLHPNCQVLNHAGMRIFNWRMLNFMKSPNRETLERFLRYAIYISGRGQRGNYGGSITYSHAFQYNKMNELYATRFGNNLIKDTIHSFVWKESLRIANFLRENNVNISNLTQKFPELRFIQPVRNPLDCAKSNLKTGKNRLFQGLSEDSQEKATVSAILDEYKWFLEIKCKNPEKYFYFMQYDFTKEMLINFAQFLEMEPDEKWINDSLDIYEMKSSYTHTPELITHYRQEVEEIFHDYPDFAEELLRFVK
ncbi:MAG: hypothetical protein K9M80_05025 [Candidatus Marinimicrobia bacterium]|nr:hypothetical protein [Candidatus Neomarinimicrobiota bacterium]